MHSILQAFDILCSLLVYIWRGHYTSCLCKIYCDLTLNIFESLSLCTQQQPCLVAWSAFITYGWKVFRTVLIYHFNQIRIVEDPALRIWVSYRCLLIIDVPCSLFLSSIVFISPFGFHFTGNFAIYSLHTCIHYTTFIQLYIKYIFIM